MVATSWGVHVDSHLWPLGGLAAAVAASSQTSRMTLDAVGRFRATVTVMFGLVGFRSIEVNIT
jgi:hypothetical protein